MRLSLSVRGMSVTRELGLYLCSLGGLISVLSHAAEEIFRFSLHILISSDIIGLFSFT